MLKRQRRKRLWIFLGVLLVLLVAGIVLRMINEMTPDPTAIPDRLAHCPDSPNCVCSQDPKPSHAIAPLQIWESPATAWERLRRLLADQPRAREIVHQDGYMRWEFRSRWFRFADDVEFRLDEAAGVIHWRSASRLGYSDLGVNRRRLEALRAAYQATPS